MVLEEQTILYVEVFFETSKCYNCYFISEYMHFFSKNKLLYCKLLAVGDREIEGYLNLFLFVFIIRIVIKILQINLKPLVKCKRIFSTLQYGKHTAYTHSFSVQLDHQLEI